MSRLAHDRQGGPLTSHYTVHSNQHPNQSIRHSLQNRLLTLTFRILQASHALRSRVLLLSMGKTMTQWMLPFFNT